MYYLYRFLNEHGEILYLGKSQNIEKRMYYHFSSRGHLPQECYKETSRIEILPVNTKTEMNIKEIYYISKFNCKYNSLDKNEPVYYKDLEKNDVWKEFDFKKTVTSSLESKIFKLESEILELKEKNKSLKRMKSTEVEMFRKHFQGYYELLDVIELYKNKTNLTWVKENNKIKLIKV